MRLDPTLILAWLVSGAIVALFLVLIWRALFADRSRGRRRCPRCWHDLQQTPGLRCPECGKTVRDERQFFGTRRRWRSATLLTVGLFVAAMIVRVQITGENVFDYAPTWLLTRSLPYSSTNATARDPIRGALESRTLRGDLSPEQILEIARRIRAGDPDAAPTSDAWQNRYGSLLVALTNRGLDALAAGLRPLDRSDPAGKGDPYLTALESFRDLPARPLLSAAPEWPADEPLIVELRIDEWWPPTTYARIRVRDLSDGSERTIGLDSGGTSAPAYPFTFAPLSLDEQSRQFEVTIESRRTRDDGTRDGDAPWGPEHRTTLTVPVRAAPALTLTPFEGTTADETIRQVFREGLVAWRSGWRRFGLRFDPSRTATPEFAGVLIGLDIEVREGEILRRHSRIWWTAGSGPAQARWEILYEDRSPIEALAAADAATASADSTASRDETPSIPAESGRWTVRIRGDREVAMKALATIRTPGANAVPFTQYWKGEVSFPIAVRVEDAPSPRRRWFALPPDDLAEPPAPAPAIAPTTAN